MGNRIGITKSGVSAIESGARNVTEKHIIMLRQFCGVNENWLRTGDESDGIFVQQKASRAETLMRKYSFPDIVSKLLKTYEGLNDDQQKAVLDYARSFVSSILADVQAEEMRVSELENAMLRNRLASASDAETGNESEAHA